MIITDEKPTVSLFTITAKISTVKIPTLDDESTQKKSFTHKSAAQHHTHTNAPNEIANTRKITTTSQTHEIIANLHPHTVALSKTSDTHKYQTISPTDESGGRNETHTRVFSDIAHTEKY